MKIGNNDETFALQSVLQNTACNLESIADSTLKQNALIIQKAFDSAEIAQGTIAVTFAACAKHIEENPNCGYKSIADFGERVFGLKKSQSYSLAVIGSHQRAITDKKGNVLRYVDDFTTTEKPYGNTALQVILRYCHKYGEDEVTAFVKERCNSEMSFRELTKKLKMLDKRPILTTNADSTENANADSAENANADSAENANANSGENDKKVKMITLQMPENIALAIRLAIPETDSDMLGTLIDLINASFKAKSNSVRLEKAGHWNVTEEGKKHWVSSEIQ